MSGPAHLHYLVVSLYTLRKHYDGPIEVWSYVDSWKFVQKIAQDSRLNIIPQLWHTDYRGKNSQFLNKILMCSKETADVRIYLDADTTIHGPLQDLFLECIGSETVFTQFNNWKTNGSVIRARVRRLLDYPDINPDKVNRVLKEPFPSPNGGIFCCRPTSLVLQQWYKWSWLAKDVFICDESVLQVLQLCYEDRYLKVLKGGKYNCSHKYGESIKDPVVYHYHGNSCSRPDKSPLACAMWWPLYEHCLNENIGNILSWRKQAVNKHMDRLKNHPDYSKILA